MIEFIEKKNKDNLIIFIHGFIGGKDTWIRKDGKDTILDYLKKDNEIVDKYDFAVFDYFTKITDSLSKGKSILGYIFGQKWKLEKNISIEDIAEMLQSVIRYKCGNYHSIALITHSMGGLVAKYYLLEEIRQEKISPVRLYISLAVPHKGSELATFGKFIFKNPQIEGLDPLSNIISELNNNWIKSPKLLPNTLYFQCKNDQIVPKTSAIGFDARDREIVYTDDDHFSIVCPEVHDGLVMDAIKNSCLDQSKIIPNDIEAIQFNEASYIEDGKNFTKELKKTSVIKFLDDFYPSEVSLKSFLNDFDFNNSDIKIVWPIELTKALTNVRMLLEEAKNYLEPSSKFYKEQEAIVSDFFDSAANSIKYSDRILNNAPKRLPMLAQGMVKYFAIPSLIAMKNFLILCNFNIQYCLAGTLNFSLVKQDYEFQSFNDQFNIPKELRMKMSARTEVWVPKLFSITPPIYWADVRTFSGQSFQEYFWGKRKDITEAYLKYNGKAVINGWVEKYLIPQVELFMCEQQNSEIINYTETVTINKIRDNNFSEDFDFDPNEFY